MLNKTFTDFYNRSCKNSVLYLNSGIYKYRFLKTIAIFIGFLVLSGCNNNNIEITGSAGSVKNGTLFLKKQLRRNIAGIKLY